MSLARFDRHGLKADIFNKKHKPLKSILYNITHIPLLKYGPYENITATDNVPPNSKIHTIPELFYRIGI